MQTLSWSRRWLWVLPAVLMQVAAHAEPSIDSEPAFNPDTLVAATKHTKRRSHVAHTQTTPGRLEVRSNAVLVMDESDASIVYSRRAEQVMPIASITKLMTALVVLDGHQPMDEILEISRADRDTIHNSTSRLGFGTEFTREDLLHLALMSSENRAAHALGRHYPGGLTAFVRTMNLKAKALGMHDTHFVEPTGLSSDNVSTAADLAKLVIAASRDPDIRRFSTDDRYTVKVGRQMLEFRNTNSLVTKPNWDITVQKTGYTADAGRCLVMKSTIKDRPVVMILLNSTGKYTRVADASRIRKWLESNPAMSTQLAATEDEAVDPAKAGI